MRTRLVLATVPVALVSMALAAPSSAAPKKKKPPITKSYTATASPDPTPNVNGACNPITPAGKHVEPFAVPAAGRLVVTMDTFMGDWDLCVLDADGAIIASSTGFVEATTESVSIKFKKAAKTTIVAANAGGGPTAAVKYTFTYN